jgi:hypothetical protein
VRLDHLLSKEHLRGASRAGARDLCWSGWGARRRRHWPVRSGNGSWCEYDLWVLRRRRVGKAVHGCGWGGRLAPCWALREQPWAGLGGSVSRRWWCRLVVVRLPGVWLLFQPGMTVGAHRSSSGGAGAVGTVVGWSLVENCTVDASILFSVVKLSRADGGCLGTRSR